MDIPLSQAPDIFFDQTLWRDFCALFKTKEIALARISVLPFSPTGFYNETDPIPGPTNAKIQKIEAAYQLGIKLVGSLKTQLISGELSASGVQSHLDERVQISGEKWAGLWPEFVHERAMGSARYEQVILRGNPDRKYTAKVLKAKVAAWLREQFQPPKKEELRARAAKVFGPALSVRIFNAAYREVFNKSRGRPKNDIK